MLPVCYVCDQVLGNKMDHTLHRRIDRVRRQIRLQARSQSVKTQKCLSCPCYGMKSCKGSRGIAPLVLNLVTRWGCVVGLTPQALCHRERTPCALNSGWCFPRTDMNILDKRKICCLYWNSNSGSPNLQPCCYTYNDIPAPIKRRRRLDWYKLTDLCTLPPKC